MKTLFSSVAGIGFLLCSALVQAVALPVRKSCAGDGCPVSMSYVVSKSGITCADCQVAVNTEAPSPVQVISSERTNLGKADTRPGGRFSSDQVVSVLNPQENLQLDRICQLYLPGQRRVLDLSSERGAAEPDFDVARLMSIWTGSLYLASDLERTTETVLEHWQGENERRFDKRLQVAKIRWSHYLPLPVFSRAVMVAMVLQDRLEMSAEFAEILQDKSKTLVALTNLFLELEHELMTLHRQERDRAQGDSVDESISSHFAGMHIGNSNQAALRGFKSLDARLEKLQAELGFDLEHVELFRQLFGQEYQGFREAPSVYLTPWFTVKDELLTQPVRTRSDEEKVLGYFSDVLKYRKPKQEGLDRQALSEVFPAMAEGKLLALGLGHVEWLVRRSGSSTYRLYLPGFWSADFADSDELLDGIEVLHKSMMEAMEAPLKRDVHKRIRFHELGIIGARSVPKSGAARILRRVILRNMGRLMERPIVPAVAVATVAVTGGILAWQCWDGKSAP